MHDPTPTAEYHWTDASERDDTAASGAILPLRLRREPEAEVVEIEETSVVLGRHSEADVRVPYSDVSRRHCCIFIEEGAWKVKDLGSLNGVYLNGKRQDVATLYPGDRLRIGSVTFVIERATAVRNLKGLLLKNEALRSIAKAIGE